MNIKSICRSLAIITAMVMFFAAFGLLSGITADQAAAATETKVNRVGTVTDGPLNVRSGPGTSYKVLDTLSKGDKITVLTKKTNSSGTVWYKYKYSSTKYGYVSSEYVKTETSVNKKGTVDTDGASLNVRSGSGTEYSKIGTVSDGKVITVLTKIVNAKGETWYKFKYSSSKTGYVSAKYIKLETESNDKVTNFQRKGTAKTALAVRAKTSTSATKLGTIKEGKAVYIEKKVTKQDGTIWYKIDYNDKEAYVRGKYVKLTNIVSETGITRKAIVEDGPLNVRSGPGSSYDKLGSLAEGKGIFISQKLKKTDGSTWYKFKYDSKTAYVNAKYMKLTKIVSETSMSKKGTLKQNANIRSGPDSTYSKIDVAMKGKTKTFVQKIKKSDGEIWYKYKYSSSKYGYIYGSYISFDTGVTFKLGTVTTDSGVTLNVRSGAGTEYSKLGSLSSGAVVTVLGSKKADNGKVWYKFQFTSEKLGWVCSDYMSVKTVTSSSEFESYMKGQGFPDSYKPGLRALKAAHPNWIFKSYDVGCTWAKAVEAEDASPGRNVVDSSLPKSYRSKDSDCYNSKTGVWSRYDGRWYSAHTDVIRYYMDPRNFLNESGIYQFLTHKYDGSSQNANTVAAVVDGTFMETRDPGNGWKSFSTLINKAGEKSGVNPNVLAAMIIQEQGTKGTSGCISGTVSGYKGYYNFLNIGAWTTSTMSAVERGLWYAKQQGWDTEYKSIKGGADIYYENYVERNQYTFYTKKFNVMNGPSKIGTHQYMTNVQGAQGEAAQLKKAFPDNYSKALTFIIPVYDSMPSSPCDLP